MTDPTESSDEKSAASQSGSPPEAVSAKPNIRIGSQRDVANKALSPQHPQAVRRAADRTKPAGDSSPSALPDNAATPSPPVAPAPAEANQAEPVASIPLSSAAREVEVPSAEEPDEPSLSLDEEIAAALGGMSIEQLLNQPNADDPGEIAPETRLSATVTRIHGDDVFVKLRGRAEGVASLRGFAQPPALGQVIEVYVKRFNDEEGLYDVSAPGASIDVANWSDLVPGAIVEFRVTGTNTGGLEGTVNNIRGFIPASQVALYRVEQFSDYIQQKLQCIVTEADPSRKRLVLSRRAVLEREKAAQREQLLKTIEAGQTLPGLVTKLMDFGAFVDVGGLEGLVHISKLSWDRVAHPSEVLQVGQKIKVKVEKIEAGSGKLSLSYRDTLQDPWENIEQKFPVNSLVSGTVSRIAQFGAFVKLEPGVEGLVHISELAHHRVFAVKNVVNEGDQVEVKVLSIDRPAQRMSLSLKATQAKPEPRPDAMAAPETPDEPARPVAVAPRQAPLKGGRDRSSGGEGIGLNW